MQWETADRRGRVSLLTRSGSVIVRMERRHGSTSPIAFLEVPALDRCAAALNIVRFYLDFMPDPEPPAMPPPSPA